MSWWYFFPGALTGFVIFLLFVAVLVRWIILSALKRRYLAQSSPEDDTSLQILKERYARGEISKDQLDKMKEELGLKP